MADLKTRLNHLDEALATGHLALNTALSTDTVRVWESSDCRTTLTLTAVDHVGRVVASISTSYDGLRHEWLTVRHWEHELIVRALEAVGFVETPVEEPDEQVQRVRAVASDLRDREKDLMRRHDEATNDRTATALLSSAALIGDAAHRIERALDGTEAGS